MGVRFASSRRLDVVVMAPALTEAGQSPNFKLPHATHVAPASPLAVLNGLHKYSVSKLLKNGLISKTVSKFGESGKYDNQCLNGNPHNVSEESDSISLDRLATLAIATELLKVGKNSHSAALKPGAFKRTSVQGGDTIMNNCDQFMEDHDINMGIQSTAPVPSVDSSNYVKEKNIVNDIDQLFNLGAVITSDMGSSSDLGHVDDLLQVINNMESSAAEPDSTAFRHMEGSESDEMFPMPDGADLAGGLSSFERVLFNDEEVMDICGGAPLVDPMSLAEQDKEVTRKERIVECQRVQFELERKCDWLVRRLRKLQGRAMGKHIGEELQGLLQYNHQMMEVKRRVTTSNIDLSGPGNSMALTGSVDVETQSSRNEHRFKLASESAISTMIQRLDLVSQQQATIAARQRSSKYSQSERIPEVVPRLDSDVRQELDHVSSQLHTQLKMIETTIDSDATASSSGGESCDEMQSFNNQHQLHLTISKRAAWKWARDRAEIAGRWTWLQAQISDLEYRIRQHNELHRTLRLSKGAVVLGEHPTTSSASVADESSTSSRNHMMVVNGFHGTLPGATSAKPRGEALNGTVLPPPPSSPPPVSRTRPLDRAVFRKRKLLQGVGLHVTSKKAARPATMRCRCVFKEKLENPCLLCTGRFDPTITLPTDVMPVTERMSVLDPTLHPVLSLQDEVRESLHYASLLHTAEYQQKMLRTTLKVSKPPIDRQDDHAAQERRNFKIEQQRKFKTRLKKNSINNNLSSKIRRSLVKAGRKPKSYYEQNNHTILRLNSKSGSTGVRGVAFNEHRYSADYPEEGVMPSRGSRHPSPEPSGAMERYAKERRKRENSYDIDNIIIPRSYSSAARVEIITYKEIPTPKWRLVDDCETDVDNTKEKGGAKQSTGDSDLEDCSDETIAQRHDKCLAEEKKKFSTCIKLPSLMRGRAQRRTDSLAESSGANTPDPMSPANMLEQGRESCTGSPMASPPATPQPVMMTDTDGNLSQAQALLGRRRTVSQSRWPREREELFRTTSPDITLEVPPFEQRLFPIPDDIMDRILKSRPEEQVSQPIIEPPRKFTPKLQSVPETPEPTPESQPVSPTSDDSTDSILGEGDDPNDPEWTVGEILEGDRERLVKR